MALIQCSECGNDVSDKAAACPKCGNPISQTQPAPAAVEPAQKAGMSGPAKAGLWVVGLVAAFLLFGVIAGQQPGAKEKDADRTAISECRKQQADELQPLDVRRIVRGACDAMEQRFVTKYGHTP